MSASRGFIDGNLVESFLELPEPQMAQIAADLEMTVEELVKTVESLSRAIH